MQKPKFGVIVGVALLIWGGLSPMIDSKSILGSIYVLGLSSVNIPVLILAGLILIASAYNRSKIEMSIITFVVFMIPHLVQARAHQQIGDNREVHAIAGSYLIWIGSIVIFSSILSSKTDSSTKE
jgi:hypothetical protein